MNIDKKIKETAEFGEKVYNQLVSKLVELNGKMTKPEMVAFLQKADFAKIMLDDLKLSDNYYKNIELEYRNIVSNLTTQLSKAQQASLNVLSNIDNATYFNHVRDAGIALKQTTLKAILGDVNQNELLNILKDATKELSSGQIGSLLNTNLRTFSRSTFAESVSELPDDTLVQYVGGVPIPTSRPFCVHTYNKIMTIKEAKAMRNDTGGSAWIDGGGFSCRHNFIVYSDLGDGKGIEKKGFKTREEAIDYAKKKLGIRKWDVATNEESTKLIVNRLKELKKDWNFGGLDKLGLIKDKGTMAAASSRGLYINTDFFNNKKYMLESLASDVKNGWLQRGGLSPTAIIDHEIGHVITGMTDIFNPKLIKSIDNIKDDYVKTLKRLNKEHEKVVKSMDWSNFESITKGGKLKQEIKKKIDEVFISKYSLEGRGVHEFIAESFSMVLNTPDPSPFAVKVFKLLKEEYHK